MYARPVNDSLANITRKIALNSNFAHVLTTRGGGTFNPVHLSLISSHVRALASSTKELVFHPRAALVKVFKWEVVCPTWQIARGWSLFGSVRVGPSTLWVVKINDHWFLGYTDSSIQV